MENYGIEDPSQAAGLYLVPKLRNLIFCVFAGFGSFLVGFKGILVVKGMGSMQNEGKNWV